MTIATSFWRRCFRHAHVFYVSYIGQSIKDNSALPPSVLVSELLDYLDRAFEMPHQKLAREHSCVTRHRLHPFNVDYFSEGDEGLFSYSVDNCRAGEAARGVRSSSSGVCLRTDRQSRKTNGERLTSLA